MLNGRDVTKEIRTFNITTSIQYAADNPAVREQLVTWQRAAAEGADVVTEGRDQATVVFPHAECKIFLTADEDERAQRRYRDLVARGEQVTFDEVLAAQHIRDERDRTRSVGRCARRTMRSRFRPMVCRRKKSSLAWKTLCVPNNDGAALGITMLVWPHLVPVLGVLQIVVSFSVPRPKPRAIVRAASAR